LIKLPIVRQIFLNNMRGPMNNSVLDEIKSIPGILGGFVYSLNHGVRMNNLPPVFREDNLNKAGSVIDKIYHSTNTASDNITELALYYAESTIMARPIGEHVYLIVVCDPSLNRNLLTMTINMIAGRLKRVAENLDTMPDNKEISVGPGTDNVSQPGKSDDILNSGRMSVQFEGMQTALLKIMGPMSKIIFSEAVDTWAGMGEPSVSTLPELVKILLNEINDDEKESKYLKMIAPYLEND
jgi:hypothetical protein